MRKGLQVQTGNSREQVKMEAKTATFTGGPIIEGPDKQIKGELLEPGHANNIPDSVRRTISHEQESKDRPTSSLKPKSSSDSIVVNTMMEGA